MTSFSSVSVEVPDHLLARNQEPSVENLALFKAALAGSLTGVQHALEQGAKPDYFYRPEDSKNSLHVAAEQGYLDIVKELIRGGAHVDCLVVSTKETAFLLAVKNSHLEVIKYLVQAGANINAENSYGNNALNEAIRSEDETLFNYLLDIGVSPSRRNHKGSTPLHFLCYDEKLSSAISLRMARSLVKAGADVNARNHNGLTPLLVCCSSGREDLIDFLLEEGADPTVHDHSGQSAADIARFYEQKHLVQRFSHEAESPFHRFK